MSQRGFTLIEVILAVAIAIGVTAATLKKYSSYRHEQNLALAESHLRSVRQAGEAFFVKHCSDTPRPSPNATMLVSNNFLQGSDWLNNPFGSDFTFSIEWGNPSALVIRSTITAAGSMEDWRARLDATSADARVLTWRWVPTLVVHPEYHESTLYRAMYEPECD